MRSLISLCIIVALLSSCKTYIIPKDMLVDQLGSIDSTRLVTRYLKGSVIGGFGYLANPIVEIKCVDKSGQPQTLTNSPSIEMRVTRTNGKRTIFYFDRTLIQDNYLIGIRSRFAPSVDAAILLDDIELIEIQDGKKDFRYKN
jgi:hypothetical protein